MSTRLHTPRLLTCLVALATLGLVTAASAEASSPRLARAVAVDADSDGSVDGFDLTFSGKVLGGRAARGPFAFRVAGYSVTAVGRARRRHVRVRVAEKPGCDVGASPRVSYRPRGGSALTDSRKRRVRASKLDMGRRLRGAPRIVCAVTRDRDRDGHLDAVEVTYSKRIHSRARARGPFVFSVDRYVVRSVEGARGRTVTVLLNERSSFDTGEVPAVTYRHPQTRGERAYAVAGRGGRARGTTFNDTRDKVAPMLVSARTDDADRNGLVDGIVARFSETVKVAKASVSVAGARVTSVAGSGRTGLVTRLAEGPLGTAARPAIAYGAGSGVVRDLAGNVTSRIASRAADGAAPVLTTARTSDRGGVAGRLDTLSLAFSEPVSHPADADGSYPFGVTGYKLASAGAANGSQVELTVNEGPSVDTGARPPVGYTRGSGAPVRDAAGNEAAARAFAGTSDGIAPRLIAATTLDGDSDGRLDGIGFDFSEPVAHAAEAAPHAFSVTGGGLAPGTAQAASGSSVDVAVAEGSFNSGLRPTVGYSPDGSNDVVDAAGNHAAAASLVQAIDGAPPVVVSAQTADSDADAKIDRVQMTFSEPLAYGGDATAPYSLSAAGYTVAGVDAASGTALTVRLQEAAGPDTGSAPAISYTGGGGVALRDLNAVEHATRSYPGLTRDAVAPVFIGAKTADDDAVAGNQRGLIDAVDLLYSEEIAGSPNLSFFDVPGHTVESVAFGPDHVALRIQEGGSPDTDARPNVSYVPGDLHDVAEGPGDTVDQAPGASLQADDGAGPAVVSAGTGDTDADGQIDQLQMSFSEPIDYAPGVPAPIALSDGLGVASVGAPSGSSLTATVTEAGPNGGLTPSVTVSPPDRITDLATTPNPARGDAFSATTDGVRPTLVSGRTGEAASATCTSAPIDGIVDCFRADWSEPVVQPSGTSAFTIGGFTMTGILSAGQPSYVDVTVQPGSTPDRDRETTVGYTGGGADEVTDVAGNPALDGTAIVSGACDDTSPSEPNDTQAPDNPLLSDPVDLQALCAGDDDWFRVTPQAGELHIAVDPVSSLGTVVTLYDSTGIALTAPTASGPDGHLDLIDVTGLGAGPYWLRVNAPFPQEGSYCVDVTHVLGEECDDGDLIGN